MTPFGTSTIGATIADLILNFGLIAAGVITAVLGIWIAFVGLGWAIGKFKKYVARKKF